MLVTIRYNGPTFVWWQTVGNYEALCCSSACEWGSFFGHDCYSDCRVLYGHKSIKGSLRLVIDVSDHSNANKPYIFVALSGTLRSWKLTTFKTDWHLAIFSQMFEKLSACMTQAYRNCRWVTCLRQIENWSPTIFITYCRILAARNLT